MYIRKEVQAITEIPARRIQFYSDSGLLNLTDSSPGKGKERLYSKENILELLIISELSKYKIGLSEIKRILLEVIGGGSGNLLSMVLSVTEDSPSYFLYILGRDVFVGRGGDGRKPLTETPEEWKSSMENNNSGFFISLSRLAKKVNSL